MKHLTIRKHGIGIFLLSALFTVLVFLQRALETEKNSALLPKDAVQLLLGAGLFFLASVLCLAALFQYGDEKAAVSLAEDAPFGRKIKKHEWIRTAVILLIPYLAIYSMCFPGNVHYDTGTAILHFDYLKAFYLQTNAYYTPQIVRSDLKRHALVGISGTSDTFLETAGLKGDENAKIYDLAALDDISVEIPFFGLFAKIGLYTWLLLIAAVRLFQKGQAIYLISFAPIVMVFIGCCLSPVNGCYRYAFPMILSTPILFVLSLRVPDISGSKRE